MALAALVPVEQYLSTTWDPDREYVEGRFLERNVGELDHSHLQFLLAKVTAVRGERPRGCFLRMPSYIAVEILSPGEVETADGMISIPLSDIFAVTHLPEEE